MKLYVFGYIRKIIPIIFIVVPLSNFGTSFLSADELYLNELTIDSSTKFDDKKSDLPTNPFKIVEMIRRANSLNDATKPSDAIDAAIESFNMIEQNKKL